MTAVYKTAATCFCVTSCSAAMADCCRSHSSGVNETNDVPVEGGRSDYLRAVGIEPVYDWWSTPRKFGMAIVSSDIAMVRSLLEIKASPNDYDVVHGSLSFFELAVLRAAPEITRIMLTSNTCEMQKKTFRDAFLSALKRNTVTTLDVLLEFNDTNRLLEVSTLECMCAAVRSDNPAIIQRLIDRGASPVAPKYSGSPLEHALRSDCLRSARFLFEVIPKVGEKGLCIALFNAVNFNDYPVAKLLLEQNANPNHTLIFSETEEWELEYPRATPLHHASDDYHRNYGPSIVKLLVEHKANVNARGQSGDTPLHRAAREGRVKTVKNLLLSRAAIDLVSYRPFPGLTALDFAAREGHTKIVKMLLKWGSDYTRRDADGKPWRPADELAPTIEIRQILKQGRYVWHPERHGRAPRPTRAVVKCFTMIRSLVPESCVSALPNELLFEIFAYL